MSLRLFATERRTYSTGSSLSSSSRAITGVGIVLKGLQTKRPRQSGACPFGDASADVHVVVLRPHFENRKGRVGVVAQRSSNAELGRCPFGDLIVRPHDRFEMIAAVLGEKVAVRHVEEARHRIVVDRRIAARRRIGRITVLEFGAEGLHDDVDRPLPIFGKEGRHRVGDLPAAGRQFEVLEPVERRSGERLDVELVVHRRDRRSGAVNHLGSEHVLERLGHMRESASASRSSLPGRGHTTAAIRAFMRRRTGRGSSRLGRLQRWQLRRYRRCGCSAISSTVTGGALGRYWPGECRVLLVDSASLDRVEAMASTAPPSRPGRRWPTSPPSCAPRDSRSTTAGRPRWNDRTPRPRRGVRRRPRGRHRADELGRPNPARTAGRRAGPQRPVPLPLRRLRRRGPTVASSSRWRTSTVGSARDSTC